MFAYLFRSLPPTLIWQVLEARRETLGEHHPGTLLAMSNYGRLLQERGSPAEAALHDRHITVT